MTRTRSQARGDAAEALVAARLAAGGWTILGRQVRIGRSELDLVALDPGPPARLVAVEVRWRSRRDWGLAEETVDRRKLARLRAGLWALLDRGLLPDGTALPRGSPAVDLVAVEPGRPGAPTRVRHHRSAG